MVQDLSLWRVSLLLLLLCPVRSLLLVYLDSLGRPPTRVLHDGGSVFLAFHNNGEKGLFSCFSCLQVFQLFLYQVLHGWYDLREHVLFYSFSSLAPSSGGVHLRLFFWEGVRVADKTSLFSLDLHPFGWMKGETVPLNACVFLVLGLLFSNWFQYLCNNFRVSVLHGFCKISCFGLRVITRYLWYWPIIIILIYTFFFW